MFVLQSRESLGLESPLHWGEGRDSGQSQNVAQLLQVRSLRWKVSEIFTLFLFQEIKGETVDEDLQNLDPAFLQGMNLHNLVCRALLSVFRQFSQTWQFTTWWEHFIIILIALINYHFDHIVSIIILVIFANIYLGLQVREFEMEAGGSHLGILALADDTLAGLNDNDS